MAAKTKTWKALWPVITALVLLGLISGGWFWVKNQAQTRFADQQLQLNGKPALTCSNDSWSGYPFQMKMDCQDPVLHLSRGRTKLTPKTLTAMVRATSPRTVLIHIDGPTVISNAELTAPIEIDHARAVIKVHIENKNLIRAATDLSSLAIAQAGTRLGNIDALHLEAKLQREAEHNIDIDADLTNLTVHTDDGQEVVLAAVAAAINAANVPREPAADGAEWLKAAAGLETRFNVNQFTARYGATEFHAEGTVTIEAGGTLDGTVKTRVTKLKAFLGDLQERQVLTPKRARTASKLLGLFDKGNGVAADLRLKGGEFFWGPVKLGQQTPLF